MTEPVRSFIRPAPLPPADAPLTIVDQVADVMTSGATGFGLLRLLRRHFARVTRDEMFLAAAVATSIHEADRLGLVADLQAAEATVASLQAAKTATGDPAPQCPAVAT